MNHAYIVDAARTAIGSLGGSLAAVSSSQMASTLVRTCLDRSGLSPLVVDELIFGSVLQAGQGQNLARQVGLSVGVRVESTAVTVNMVCGSGLRAVIDGARTIALGENQLVVAGGAESMSNSPFLLSRGSAIAQIGGRTLVDSILNDGLWDVTNNYHMGVTAENIAAQYGISRERQDEFALASQKKAEEAITEGRFDREIVPVSVPRRKGDPEVFRRDEHPRFGSSLAKLAELKPAFLAAGTVTAGNSSGINDGAACVLLAGKELVDSAHLKPLGRVVSYAYRGIDPSLMGMGPVAAVHEALSRAGWSTDDVDLFEVNEAFSAQSIAVCESLKLDLARVNVNGGSIALGHPIGASGARILTTLLHELIRRKGKRGLATLCIGGGMGIAICVEREDLW